jgi:serine protease Do
MRMKRSNWFGCWACLAAAILLSCMSASFASAETDTHNTDKKTITRVGRANSSVAPLSEREAQAAIASAKSLSTAFRYTSSRLLPSVVAIENRPDVEQYGSATVASNPRSQPFGGVGSGVIIDSSGLVLTNNHVVAGGGTIIVRLHDGREFEAIEVLTDPTTDIAVVRISGAEKLVAASLGNSNNSYVGDWVLALGQPFGLESTVTAGIISAKGRGIGLSASEYHIQTDAAINPGNSGGPMVNLDGQVIGINTAISSSSGGSDGIGFAVPINLAKWVADQLIEKGSVQRAFLGIGIQPITQELADHFGVQPRQGLLITQVLPESPADLAGLRSGDVLVRFAGARVSAPNEFHTFIDQAEVGQPYELLIRRDGKEKTLVFTAGSQPEPFGRTASTKPHSNQSERPSSGTIGLRVGELDFEIAKKLGLDSTHGIVITAIRTGSPAQLAGLQPGMVIVEANRQAVQSLKQFGLVMEDADFSDGVLFLVKSRFGTRYVVVKS